MKVPMLLLLALVGSVLADIKTVATDGHREEVKANTDLGKNTTDHQVAPPEGKPGNAERDSTLGGSQATAGNSDGATDDIWDEDDDDDIINLDDAMRKLAAEKERIDDLIDTYDDIEDLQPEDDDVVDIVDAEEEEPELEISTTNNNNMQNAGISESVSRANPDAVSKDAKQPAMAHQPHDVEADVVSPMTSERSATGSLRRPNIVILLADDVGMGDIGCFGNDTMKTPNIDQLAKDGVKMTHHLAAASVCSPSRAALLTGRYPVRSGMAPSNTVRVNIFVASTGGLPPSEITIAELAKEQGYATGYIGKWHLGMHCGEPDFCHHPNMQGFDHFYGLPLTNLKDFGSEGSTVTKSRFPHMDYYLVMAALLGVATALFFRKTFGTVLTVLFLLLSLLTPTLVYWTYTNLSVLNAVLMRNLVVVEQPLNLDNRLAARLAAEATAFIDEQVRREVPFLLVVGWVQAHTALHSSPEFTNVSAHGRYGDNVEEMDWSVGQVLAALEKHHVTDDTLVYFSSDNGAHIEEFGPDGERWGGWNGIYRGGKAMGGMEGGVRVPAVLRFPGRVPADSVLPQPTSQMDVFTTAARLMGAGPPSDRPVDGVDLLPLLQGEAVAPPHEFLFHYCGTSLQAARYSPNDGTNDVYKVHFATPNWLPSTENCQLVCGCYGNSVEWHDPPLVYNVAGDPSERSPLGDAHFRYAEVLEKVRAAVEVHKAGVEPVDDQTSPWRLVPFPSLQPCCGPASFPNCHCAEPPFTGNR